MKNKTPTNFIILFVILIILTLYNSFQTQTPNKHEFSEHLKKQTHHSYLIENAENKCTKNQLVLVYVFTSSLRFDRRNLIRNTWSDLKLFP